MRKVDSFIKESQRFFGLGVGERPFLFAHLFRFEYLSCPLVSMTRKVLKDFTFSNGTVIPAGCILNIASFPMHHDGVCVEPLAMILLIPHILQGYFSTPDQFDGFRFARMPANESVATAKNQLTSLQSTFLLFGHGRSAWYVQCFNPTLTRKRRYLYDVGVLVLVDTSPPI